MDNVRPILLHLMRLAEDQLYFESRYNFFKQEFGGYINITFDETIGKANFYEQDHNGNYIQESYSFYDTDIDRLRNWFKLNFPMNTDNKEEFRSFFTSKLDEISSALKGKKDSRKYLQSELKKLSGFIRTYEVKSGKRNRSYIVDKKFYRSLRILFRGLVKKQFISGDEDQWMALFNMSLFPTQIGLRWIDMAQKKEETNRATLIYLMEEITKKVGIPFQHGIKIIEFNFLNHKGGYLKNIKESKRDLIKNKKNTPRFKQLKSIIESAFPQ